MSCTSVAPSGYRSPASCPLAKAGYYSVPDHSCVSKIFSFLSSKKVRIKRFLDSIWGERECRGAMTVVKGIVWMQIRECNVNKPIRSRIYIYKYIV